MAITFSPNKLFVIFFSFPFYSGSFFLFSFSSFLPRGSRQNLNDGPITFRTLTYLCAFLCLARSGISISIFYFSSCFRFVNRFRESKFRRMNEYDLYESFYGVIRIFSAVKIRIFIYVYCTGGVRKTKKKN